MNKIDGRARTVRELLSGAKYTVDFYQREYGWHERQVRELIDDLTGKFLDFYDSDHARHDVEKYGAYFLGSIVISHKRGQRFIVDGQQRLTTLTLLLIHLHHLQKGMPDPVDVSQLVYSEKFGRKSFNIEVHDRLDVMQKLLNGDHVDLAVLPDSARNIAVRYQNIANYLPEDVTGPGLTFFVDWLLENVHLIEIEAMSDEDAYTIFETMNDRGLPLSLPEMLKGYVLANITHESDQRTINDIWKQHMQDLREVGDGQDVDFFKNWLRARHAETIRPGKEGAENKDYERIGSEFHRWVRDQRVILSLKDSNDFVQFVKRDLDFFARQTALIQKAARTITPELESIRFNDERGFTLQTQLLLAALNPADSPAVVRRKLALVADFIDIWLARRIWNFRTVAYSSVRYTVFTLTKELRDKNISELSNYLRAQLDQGTETFASETEFRLHQQNYKQVRHILARLTLWVDQKCGLPCHFEDLVSEGRARPFEIEHIWADKYEQFEHIFRHPSEFETARNRIGGLILLQAGLNQSLSDSHYEKKRDAYVSHGQNLLARTLHPLAYQNNPAFKALREETELPFRAIENFGINEQNERQELYSRIAEWVWNPSRLDLDGIKPPVLSHLEDLDDELPSTAKRPARHHERLRFWTNLLEYAKTQSELHSRISPGYYSWVGTRRDGQHWNFAVLENKVRIELYIDSLDATKNKAIFDKLESKKTLIESNFRGRLVWERLSDKRGSRISTTVDGGWRDEPIWNKTIPGAVDAMSRLYAALSVPLRAIQDTD